MAGKLKKYTQEEFNVMERNEYGRKICPSGDYTDIKIFPAKCVFEDNNAFGNEISFDEGCEFGSNCEFGHHCSFGQNCIFEHFSVFGDECVFWGLCEFGNNCTFNDHYDFGYGCDFGYDCTFGNECDFGTNCTFGNDCTFGNECHFANECQFSDGCTLNVYCTFGEDCEFSEGCKVEKNIVLLDFLKFEGFGSESRCTYFFKHPEGIYVRCGCFAGTIEEFRNKVQKTHKSNNYAQGYLKIADLAEWQFNDKQQKQLNDPCVISDMWTQISYCRSGLDIILVRNYITNAYIDGDKKHDLFKALFEKEKEVKYFK